MKKYWTRFLPNYPQILIYMLQSCDYDIKSYISWLNRTDDFRQVMIRRELDYTNKAKLLLLFIWLVSIVLYIYSVISIIQSIASQAYFFGPFGLIVFILTPLIVSYVVIAPLWLGRVLIQDPLERKTIENARQTITKHPAVKIAIVGSYGKTTAKEVLSTILREGKIVAATPGNINTPLGISQFATGLKGDEDVLIFELGEGKPGDIKELCELTQPTIGVMTGISEAHLESFGTIEEITREIFEIAKYLGDKPLYKNAECELIRNRINPDDKFAYTRMGVSVWKLTGAKTDFDGTQIETENGYEKISAHSGLLGYHNVGIVLAATSIANYVGLNSSQIQTGINNIRPFDHRMQPRNVNGAWIIDDTYNGNSQGVKAGLELLKQLNATRRIYVTPGLVEQGSMSQVIHEDIGRQIASVADVAVLMRNSVTDDIAKGLQSAGFKGQLKIIDNPKEFYLNIDQFVASGDVVLMQNDWTDNYA